MSEKIQNRVTQGDPLVLAALNINNFNRLGR